MKCKDCDNLKQFSYGGYYCGLEQKLSGLTAMIINIHVEQQDCPREATQ